MSEKPEQSASTGRAVLLAGEALARGASEHAPQPERVFGADAERLLSAAARWLEEYAVENLGTRVLLSRFAADRPPLLHVFEQGGRVSGVSGVTATGDWFLEAADAASGCALIGAVERSATPRRLCCSEKVKAWARPELLRTWTIAREHNLLAMVARSPVAGGEGRWASLDDEHALEAYQRAYNAERRTSTVHDWAALIGSRSVAVLERAGQLIGVVVAGAETDQFVSIGGTFTYPEFRRLGHARRLLAFTLGECLARRPGVHLIVDDDNESAIALYEDLGFVEIGSCYIGYLT